MLSKAIRKGSLRSENHDEFKKNLLADLKKNVKSLMELLALRKLVNEDSGVVYMLCLSIEACVRHGLRRRAFDTFTNSDTYYVDLLSRLDQLGCASAAFVSSRIRTLKQRSPSATSSSPVYKVFSFGSSRSESTTEGSQSRDRSKASRSSLTPDQFSERVLWIRIALVDKHLPQILTALVTNASVLYQSYALFADTVCGPLIPALLAGPCSIDYSHLRGSDIPSYGDNSVDDLLNRRKSLAPLQRPPSRQNLLARTRHFSIAAGDLLPSNRRNSESVSSMGGNGDADFVLTPSGLTPTNSRAPELIYAKNNVAMEPCPGSSPILGYLTVCVTNANDDFNSGVIVRWTPNNIISSTSSESSSPPLSRRLSIQSIRLSDISHIHCHTRPHSDSHATIVFIGRDGVQFPAMVFNQATSALSLLQALTASSPGKVRLEPPLNAAAFDVDNESRDLVFQLLPVTPKPGEMIVTMLPRLPEDSSTTFNSDEMTIIDEAENKVPPMENSQIAPESKLKTSKTDFDLQSVTNRNLPSSKSVSGLSATLEAALSACTMAGAQFFNEIDNESQIDSSFIRAQQPKGVGRLTFLCRSVQRQLMARAFYGWLAYVRHVKTVRTQLAALVLSENGKTFDFKSAINPLDPVTSVVGSNKLDSETFSQLRTLGLTKPDAAVSCYHHLIYYGGVTEASLRPRLWAVLLGVINIGTSDEEISETWRRNGQNYASICAEWSAAEEQAEALSANRKLVSEDSATAAVLPTPSTAVPSTASALMPSTTDDKVFPDDLNDKKGAQKAKVVFTFSNVPIVPPADLIAANQRLTGCTEGRLRRSLSVSGDSMKTERCNVEQTSADDSCCGIENKRRLSDSGVVALKFSTIGKSSEIVRKNGHVKTGTGSEPTSASPDDPRMKMLSCWLTNLHRIDKDVARCDRSLEFFRPGNHENLAALRRIVCSYVWQHLDPGYIQGMCDLAAPFLVVCKTCNEEEAEALAFVLFSKLMDRLCVNFPTGATTSVSGPAAIDIALSRLRSLLQILDPELYEHLSDAPSELDSTHLYFAYRWLLLDFKREFVYDDVFRIWETIWAADDVASPSFSLFVAFALIETYRDVIVAENMDFTDIIKFFNDMAERHDVERVLDLARQLVRRVQETSHANGFRSP